MPQDYTIEQAARILNVDPSEIRALCNADPSLGTKSGGQLRVSPSGIERLAAMMGKADSLDFDELEGGPLDTPSSLSLGDFSDFSTPSSDQDRLDAGAPGSANQEDNDVFAGLHDLHETSEDDIPDMGYVQSDRGNDEEPALDFSFGDGIEVLGDDLEGGPDDDPMPTLMGSASQLLSDKDDPIDVSSQGTSKPPQDPKSPQDPKPPQDPKVLGDDFTDVHAPGKRNLMESASDVLGSREGPDDLYISDDAAEFDTRALDNDEFLSDQFMGDHDAMDDDLPISLAGESDDQADAAVLGDELEGGSDEPMRTVMGSSSDMLGGDAPIDLELSSADDDQNAAVLGDELDGGEQDMGTLLSSSSKLEGDVPVDLEISSMHDPRDSDVLGDDLDGDDQPMRTLMGSSSDVLDVQDGPVDLSISDDAADKDAAVLGDELEGGARDDQAGTLMGSSSDMFGKSREDELIDLEVSSQDEDRDAAVLGDELEGVGADEQAGTLMGSSSDMFGKNREDELIDLEVSSQDEDKDAAVLGDELEGVSKDDQAGTLMGSSSDMFGQSREDEPIDLEVSSQDEDRDAAVLGDELEGVSSGEQMRTLMGSSSDVFDAIEGPVDLSISDDAADKDAAVLGDDLEHPDQPMRTLMGSSADLADSDSGPINLEIHDNSDVLADMAESLSSGPNTTVGSKDSVKSEDDLVEISQSEFSMAEDNESVYGNEPENVTDSPTDDLSPLADEVAEGVEVSLNEESQVIGDEGESNRPAGSVPTLLGNSGVMFGEDAEVDVRFGDEQDSDAVNVLNPDEGELPEVDSEVALGDQSDLVPEGPWSDDSEIQLATRDDMHGVLSEADDQPGEGDSATSIGSSGYGTGEGSPMYQLPAERDDEAVTIGGEDELDLDDSAGATESPTFVQRDQRRSDDDSEILVGDSDSGQIDLDEGLTESPTFVQKGLAARDDDDSEIQVGDRESSGLNLEEGLTESPTFVQRFDQDEQDAEDSEILLGDDEHSAMDARGMTESPTFVQRFDEDERDAGDSEILLGEREGSELDAYAEDANADTALGMAPADATGSGSDVQLTHSGDLGDESDVRMVKSDHAIGSDASFLDLASAEESGSEVLSDPASEVRVGPLEGVHDLTDGQTDAADQDVTEDEFVFGGGATSDVLAGGSIVDLTGDSGLMADDSLSAPPESGVTLDSSGEFDDDSIDIGDSQLVSLDSETASPSSTGDDEEFVLEGGFGSDVTIDASDSGIGIGSDVGAVAGSGIDLGSDPNAALGSGIEEFVLQPGPASGIDASSSDDDSGSQVIALDEDSDEFNESQPTMLGGEISEAAGPMLGGEDLDAQPAFDAQPAYDAGPSPTPTPAAAAAGMTYGGVPVLEAPEEAFSPLQILSLTVTTLLLVVSSLVMVDLATNAWQWSEASMGKGIMDFLINTIKK